MATPTLDHPTLPLVKAAFPGLKLQATEFRGQTTLLVPADQLHAVMRYLRDDPKCDYNFLSDVVGVDYLGYPAGSQGRFAVVYLLASYAWQQDADKWSHLDDEAMFAAALRDVAELHGDVAYEEYLGQARAYPDDGGELLPADHPPQPGQPARGVA